MDPNDENLYKPRKSISTIFMQFMFSHFGLFIIVGLYAAAGAYVFVEIERPFEERLYEIKRSEAVAVNQTMNYMANLFWFYQDKNWTYDSYNKTVHRDLKKLEAYIIKSVNNYNYDGTVDGWDDSWTFANALLLTMTIMSTIGYGHIAPATSWGKFFCMVYAMIGCPLLLVFLGNLGSSMADSFTYLYSRCCCRSCRSRRNDEELPPKASKKQRKLLIDDVIGKEKYMPTSELKVPITLNLVLLAVYIMMGAVLFSIWEDWDLGSSTYFTFITLSTIGFGDMVPGTAVLDKDSPTSGFKMLVCICYILFGMALLSMCINLMQEQLVEKCRWLANEIGLNKSSEVTDTKTKEKPSKDPENPAIKPPTDAGKDALPPKPGADPPSDPKDVLPGSLADI